jgi:hypothetical protein
MSGFDENPFGEPGYPDPFNDPSITELAKNTSKNQQGLEDYNPFENENNLVAKPSQSQPATLQATNQNLPPYAASGQQYQTTQNNGGGGVTQISTEELQRRQEELERKAQELERREAELRNNTSGVRRNNWPPLPDKFCVQPCFYHDINVDIPSEFQRIVQNLYYLWIFYAGIMFVNVVASLFVMFHMSDVSNFFLAIFYCVLFTPASFLCWYRPVYKAFQNDSSANFMLFFFVFAFQFLVTVFQTIGLKGSGTVGFITALYQFNGTVVGWLVGIFCLSVAIAYGMAAAGNAIMIAKVHAIYRSSGASMDKARQEFQTEFFRNQTVQAAAQEGLRAAVDSQLPNRNRY